MTATTQARHDASAPATVLLERLSKHFKSPEGKDVRAVDDITIEFEGGTFVTLLGPSGIADLRGTWWAVFAAHVCFNLAVVVRIVGAAVASVDPVPYSGLISGSVAADTLYRLDIDDSGATPVVSTPVLLATGVRNGFGHRHAGLVLCLTGAGTQMWCRHHLVELEQR